MANSSTIGAKGMSKGMFLALCLIPCILTYVVGWVSRLIRRSRLDRAQRRDGAPVRSAGEARRMPVACGALATAALALLGAVNVVAATSEIVPLFISASHPSQQGFVRLINHSDQSGTVAVTATDDVGRVAGTERFDLAAWETRHFNSDDLEFGHAAKGFVGVGPGSGDWRLAVESELPLEVLTYVRTSDGFLTSMHDRVRQPGLRHLVPTFNPGSNRNQVSKIRVVNTATEDANIGIIGVDDRGVESDEISVTLPAGEAITLTAQELESGMGGLTGGLGNGAGKWQLFVHSDQHVLVQGLLESATGHLTNLSTSVATSDYVPPSAGQPVSGVTGNFALDYDRFVHPSGVAYADSVFYILDGLDARVVTYTAARLPRTRGGFPTVDLSPITSGLVEANGRLYILDGSNERVFAYTTDGRRAAVVEHDFALSSLAGGLATGLATGIAYADGLFYVAIDSLVNANRVDVYQNGERIEGGGFELTVGDEPIDIAAGPNGLLHILGGSAVFAYRPSGDPVGDAHFDLAAANGEPTAITYGNGRFYVTDSEAAMVFAYTAQGQPVE